MSSRAASLHPRTRPSFCMALRASAHTGVAIRTPAAAQTEKQRLWRIRSCLRTHPGTTLLHPRTPAHLLHVIARSGAAAPRRGNPFSCGSTKRKAILHGKSVEAANLPYVLLSCQVFLRGCGLPHQCAHWFAMTCRRKRRCCGCKDAFRQYPGSAPWQTQTPGKFLPVIARSEATRQSVLLAAAQNEKPFFPARCRKEARQD